MLFPSEKYSNLFLSRIEEIRRCLESELYLTAFSLALTLPDICGKAQYPEYGDNFKRRYSEWFDNYVDGYGQSTSPYAVDLPFLSGEVVFQLRCNLLHIGNPNIKKDKISKKDNRIDNFTIKYGGKFLGDTSVVSYGASRTPLSRSYTINMDLLCVRLCNAAEKYYRDNSEKFSFFNYQFVHTNEE